MLKHGLYVFYLYPDVSCRAGFNPSNGIFCIFWNRIQARRAIAEYRCQAFVRNTCENQTEIFKLNGTG